MYLVKTNGKIIECEDIAEVKHELMIACAIWRYDGYYVGNETVEELYNECWKDKDFGDIAQVYEIITPLVRIF